MGGGISRKGLTLYSNRYTIRQEARQNKEANEMNEDLKVLELETGMFLPSGGVTAWNKYEGDPENLIRLALEAYRGRMSREQIIDALKQGKKAQYDYDEYSGPVYFRSGAFYAAKAAKPQAQPEMVTCSCGHTVAKALVMSASMGTSCPDCYDRMSN
jgi:hypothetical protein